MGALKAVWSEFIGLFVDDGSFAVAILGWLVVSWLVLPRLPLPPAVAPVILFAGLAAILVESTVRRSRVGR